MNIKENLSIAKEIAREAGDFLLENKNKTKQIFSEKGRDIKLEIDRDTETRIMALRIISEDLINVVYPLHFLKVQKG